MRGHHPQRADICGHHCFDQHPLHAGDIRLGWPRQQVPPHLAHRQAGEDGIAELAAAATAVGHIGRRAEDRRVARQAGGQLGDLILALAAGQAGEIDRDFLQANDVEIAQLPDGLQDAREIDAAVHAAPPLDVPAQQLHARLPITRPFTSIGKPG